MAKKPDRRTLRTQTALRNALIELLRRRNYDTITVQDIIDKANVGRSTFYSHCSSKDQLFRLSFRMLRAELTEAQRVAQAGNASREKPPLTFSLPVLEHVVGHRALYPSMVRGRGREVLMSEMRLLVSELVRADLTALPGNPAVPREATTQYVVGAFMAVLAWWVERMTELSPAAVDAMFQSLTREGIGAKSL